MNFLHLLCLSRTSMSMAGQFQVATFLISIKVGYEVILGYRYHILENWAE